MLQLERMRTPADMERLAPEWDALEAQMTPRAPFRTAAWNILWWKHFREQRATVYDELYAYAIRDAGGQLLAVAPMMLTRRPGRGLPLVRELQFFGADPNMTELRGLVCRASDQTVVLAALNRELLRQRSSWDWIQWSGIVATDEGRTALEHGGSVQWREPTRDFYLELPPSWDEFRAGLSRNIKESLRKCYNSLKRDGHEFTFRVVSSPDQVAPALGRFFELHAERSRLQGTVAHPDVFARPAATAFMREYAQLAAVQDRLRIFQLEIAGCVVATRIAFVLGDEMFFYYSGYLPEWGAYSVMTTVVAEALRWAIGKGMRIANLSIGSDVSKTRWSPREVQYANAVQGSTLPQSRASFRVYRFLLEQSRGERPIGRLLQRVRRKA